MRACLRLLWFVISCGLVLANTETYQFHVPKDFPEVSDTFVPQMPYIELWNTTFNTLSIPTNPQDILLIELIGLQNNENYHVRVCWSAVDPISVKSVQHLIIPFDTEFGGVSTHHPRIILRIQIDSDSYPRLESAVPIDVNVALVKLGIPVDLYSIVLYLILVIAASVVVIRSLNPFNIFSGDKNEPYKWD